MRSLTLGGLQLDGRYVTGLSHDYADAVISASLEGAGIVAKLYSGKREGQIVELARQLVRMRTDVYVLEVSEHSWAASRRIAGALLRLRPGASVVYRCEREIVDTLGPDESILLARSTSEALRLLSDMLRLPERPVPVAPYASGRLHADDLERLGIEVADDGIPWRDDLRWATVLAGQSGDRRPIPVDAIGCTPQQTTAICGLLSEAGPELFSLTVAAQAHDRVVMEIPPDRSLGGLTLVDADGVAEATDAEGRRIGGPGPGGRSRQAAYGRNGVLVLHSGAYFDARAAGVQHLEIAPELTSEAQTAVTEWIGDQMLVRSARVLHEEASVGETSVGSSSFDREDEVGRAWPSHVYRIRRGAGSMDGTVTFDGREDDPLPLCHVPLSRLELHEPQPGGSVVVTIREPEDAAELERRLSRFHATGELTVPSNGVSMVFENSCRWLNLGACKLTMLRRMQVHASGDVSHCRDAGPIGTVGEPFDRLATEVRRSQHMEEARRSCATCVVRDVCSHCTQLPAMWSGRYCELRITYPLTSLMFELNSFPRLLKAHPVAAGSLTALRVSHQGIPPLHYHGATGAPRSEGRRPIVTIGEAHFVWFRGTPRIIQLSRTLAILAEAWWLGAETSEIVDWMGERFGVRPESAEATCRKGLASLRAGGVIDDVVTA